MMGMTKAEKYWRGLDKRMGLSLHGQMLNMPVVNLQELIGAAYNAGYRAGRRADQDRELAEQRKNKWGKR